MAVGSIDATKIRLAPRGNVFVAAALTAAPSDVTTSMTASWTNLGYCTTDGVSLNYSVDMSEINSWQSGVSTKRGLKAVMTDVTFTLQQTGQAATKIYFGDASWVNQAAGLSKLSVVSNPVISNMEHALVIEYTDDSNNVQRLYCGRGIVTKRKEISLQREKEIAYNLTFTVLDNTGSLFDLLSNNLDFYSS